MRDLPRRLVASVNGSIDATAELPELQSELLGHLRSIDAGIGALIAAIEPMREDIAALQLSIGPGASERLDHITQSMARMEGLVKHIDGRIPDPDAPGTIEKAKDAILGDG